ncbi:MAG: UDP-N-acetylmuramoyl-tripeptide--D-alanyl-D-alanine ligase [Gemmatimonadetes bacterium]|nr:UDP-N-acetylmuramoyl-tripeptide--D-alanyl-D-alanine ligase [Gemmatimonadota bacterium]
MNSFRWSDEAVRLALGVRSDEDDREFARVSTDTRAIGEGDLFVALEGERFDGHDFLEQAARSGATGAVVRHVPEGAPPELRYFQVPDTLVALGALASYRRDRLLARVVGVVGSNGKTTTKDLIRAALSSRFRVHATQGNLYNRIGVPLPLLSTPEDTESAVVEMGTNEPGEIATLAAIVRPEAVVITSIGEEHLEKLLSVEGVLEEEISVLSGLKPGGVALVAEEPPELPARAAAALGAERVRVAGHTAAADLSVKGGEDGIRVDPDGTTRWMWEGMEVHLPIPGRVNVRNALLALGLAQEWGVPTADAVAGLASVARAKLRGEWHRFGGVRVLADCYNSNPPSVAAALDLLATLPADGPKVAVLGTMRELGDATAEMHARAAAQLADRLGQGVDLIVATGSFVDAFAPLRERLGDRLVTQSDPVAAYDAVAGRLNGSEMVLLKASRGEALERWLPLLKRDFAADDQNDE